MHFPVLRVVQPRVATDAPAANVHPLRLMTEIKRDRRLGPGRATNVIHVDSFFSSGTVDGSDHHSTRPRRSAAFAA